MPEWIIQILLSLVLCGGSCRKNAPTCNCLCACQFNEDDQPQEEKKVKKKAIRFRRFRAKPPEEVKESNGDLE